MLTIRRSTRLLLKFFGRFWNSTNCLLLLQCGLLLGMLIMLRRREGCESATQDLNLWNPRQLIKFWDVAKVKLNTPAQKNGVCQNPRPGVRDHVMDHLPGTSQMLRSADFRSDWWFETCFIFPYIGNFIIPTYPNWLSYFSGGSTTNQNFWTFDPKVLGDKCVARSPTGLPWWVGIPAPENSADDANPLRRCCCWFSRCKYVIRDYALQWTQTLFLYPSVMHRYQYL